MSIQNYAQIQPPISMGALTDNRGSVAANTTNAMNVMGTIGPFPYPTTVYLLMTGTYGFGAAASSLNHQVIRTDTSANVCGSGAMQTVAATSYNYCRYGAVSLPANTPLPLSGQATVGASNCYITFTMMWFAVPVFQGGL